GQPIAVGGCWMAVRAMPGTALRQIKQKGRKMSLGLVGRKVGMMRIFKDDGTSVPVTVLDCGGNRVAQVKSQEADGYVAVQVAFGKRRATRVSKSMAGHFAKAAVEAGTEL